MRSVSSVLEANLTFLPQDATTTATHAACLDGSPYGFYFAPSKTGSTKWTVSINGGGWYREDVPFGGVMQSGIGREMGTPGFEEYLEIKSFAAPA